MIQINNNPSKKELLLFGVMLLAFGGLVGGALWWRFDAPRVAQWSWVVAGGIAAIYYAVPPIRRHVYLAWLYATYPIGWTVTHLLMAIVYYLVITPIGVAARLCGRDAMQSKFEPDAPTYWIQRRKEIDPQRYFRQF